MHGKRLTIQEYIEKCKQFNPEYDYSEIGFTTISGQFVTPICRLHGKFKINAKGLMTKHIKCPECERIKRFEEFIEKARKIHGDKYQYDLSTYKDKLNTDIYTLEDIVSSLKKPSRDPRDEMPKPILKSDVMHLEDLKKGMKLEGTVRNVAPFGVFVDVGLHNDGLIHISKLSDHFVKDPMEIVSVGDIVTCYVDDILLDKKKVSLSLIEPK